MRFSDDHLALRTTVTEFIAKEVNPHAEAWERDGAFPAHELFRKAGALGLLGITKPEAYGGMGLDYSFSLVAAEAWGASLSPAIAMAIGVQTDMATPALARFGSDELRREFLAPAIRGDYVAAVAVSETGGGSDVAALKTTARKDGDDYIISGSKMWITNGAQADFYCVLANTGEGPVHANKSLIVVPRTAPGVTVGAKLHKLGMHASDTCPIFFDDVRVPQRYRIGAEGTGFMMQMLQFQEERIFGAASALLGMEHVVRETIAYAKERHTFGQPLINNQIIHFRLAELQTEIELLRSLVYRAVDDYVAGKDCTMLASMAKLKAGRLSREVADSCLQYWGGMGFMWDNVASRAYRDSRLLSIGGGTDEIMLGIICKLMDILPKKRR